MTASNKDLTPPQQIPSMMHIKCVEIWFLCYSFKMADAGLSLCWTIINICWFDMHGLFLIIVKSNLCNFNYTACISGKNYYLYDFDKTKSQERWLVELAKGLSTFYFVC